MIARKIKHFQRETLNNLWQFRARNVFSVTIICLSFLIVGIFVSLSNNLQYTAQQLSQDMAVVLFLEKDISPIESDAITKELENSPFVQKTQFVSSKEAMAKFLEKFPELEGIVENHPAISLKDEI